MKEGRRSTATTSPTTLPSPATVGFGAPSRMQQRPIGLRLFVAFQQLDSGAAKKQQGTGLGLALTKKIVEAQGGRVGVESQRGAGSRFYAILPNESGLKRNNPNGGLAEAAAVPSAPAVLLIEDNDADLRWLSQVLTGAGYAVESARTGTVAVAKAQVHVYAAILLDLILPDIGGWEILHAIRSAAPIRTRRSSSSPWSRSGAWPTDFQSRTILSNRSKPMPCSTRLHARERLRTAAAANSTPRSAAIKPATASRQTNPARYPQTCPSVDR